MELIKANKSQPNICTSLSTQWITEMAKSERSGKAWCQVANRALEGGAFYKKHAEEQAVLTNSALLQGLQLQTAVLKHTPFAQLHEAEAMDLVTARQPVIDDLLSKTADKVQMLRLRRLSVLRSKNEATMEDLKNEFNKLADQPRYYLLSVKADKRSHMIAVVSTKSKSFVSNNGHVYYYDSNLKQVVKWRSRSKFLTFLDKSLLKDYTEINSVMQVEVVKPGG